MKPGFQVGATIKENILKYNPKKYQYYDQKKKTIINNYNFHFNFHNGSQCFFKIFESFLLIEGL